MRICLWGYLESPSGNRVVSEEIKSQPSLPKKDIHRIGISYRCAYDVPVSTRQEPVMNP